MGQDANRAKSKAGAGAATRRHYCSRSPTLGRCGQKKGPQAIGRSRGGRSTKLHFALCGVSRACGARAHRPRSRFRICTGRRPNGRTARLAGRHCGSRLRLRAHCRCNRCPASRTGHTVTQKLEAQEAHKQRAVSQAQSYRTDHRPTHTLPALGHPLRQN